MWVKLTFREGYRVPLSGEIIEKFLPITQVITMISVAANVIMTINHFDYTFISNSF
jgi:hypothetical protein